MAEPILVSIAAAVAGKAFAGLYDLVRNFFTDQADEEALAKAEQAAAEGDERTEVAIHDLADRLAAAQERDPVFAEQLRSEWGKIIPAQVNNGTTENNVSGTVSGHLVQARDIHGGISFGS